MSASPQKDPKAPPTPLPTLEQAAASDTDIAKVHNVLAREKSEPHEGQTPLPLFLVLFIALLFAWGGWYIEKNNGGYNSLVYKPGVTPGAGGAAAAPPLTPDSPEWRKKGKALYAANCQACHGPAGLGVPGAFPPLAGSEWVIGADSEKLLPRILLYGLQGPISVKGNDYNGNMPAQGASYNDAQIAQVLTYIRSEWGNSAGPITAEAVAEVRKLYGKRNPWSATELKASITAK